MNAPIPTQNNLFELTLDTLLRLSETFKPLPNPFHELAVKHDCDLTKGDRLIIPTWLFRRFPELDPFRGTENVHESAIAETVYSLKAGSVGRVQRGPKALPINPKPFPSPVSSVERDKEDLGG